MGPILLDLSQLTRLLVSTVPASGLGQTIRNVANDPSLVGKTYYAQALVATGGQLVLTNLDDVTF